MKELREQIAEKLKATRYQSREGRGERGFEPHHIEAITEAMVELFGEPAAFVSFMDEDVPLYSPTPATGPSEETT